VGIVTYCNQKCGNLDLSKQQHGDAKQQTWGLKPTKHANVRDSKEHRFCHPKMFRPIYPPESGCELWRFSSAIFGYQKKKPPNWTWNLLNFMMSWRLLYYWILLRLGFMESFSGSQLESTLKTMLWTKWFSFRWQPSIFIRFKAHGVPWNGPLSDTPERLSLFPKKLRE